MSSLKKRVAAYLETAHDWMVLATLVGVLVLVAIHHHRLAQLEQRPLGSPTRAWIESTMPTTIQRGERIKVSFNFETNDMRIDKLETP